jgi:hypothetical protein
MKMTQPDAWWRPPATRSTRAAFATAAALTSATFRHHIKLDHLRDLGIRFIYRLSIVPMRDNGCDIADYRDAPEFGTSADFDALLEAAKVRDIQLSWTWW